MEAGADTLSGGFADPAREAAVAFRAAMQAMARPGSVHALSGADAPEGLSGAAATLLLCLADADTVLWLAPALADGPAAGWLGFHTNAPLTDVPGRADFAVGGWAELAPVSRWPAGTPAYPDRSTTLIVEVPALEGGPALALSGPGIDGVRSFAPDLPEAAVAELAENATRFPLGCDLFLTAGRRVAALPRTTRIGG